MLELKKTFQFLKLEVKLNVIQRRMAEHNKVEYYKKRSNI